MILFLEDISKNNTSISIKMVKHHLTTITFLDEHLDTKEYNTVGCQDDKLLKDSNWIELVYEKYFKYQVEEKKIYDETGKILMNYEYFPPSEWFLRTENCSGKDSPYCSQPITSFSDIIRIIETSDRIGYFIGHKNKFSIYLVPYNKFITENLEWEFRVFVHNKRITAISQYYTNIKYDLGKDGLNVELLVKNARELRNEFYHYYDFSDYVLDMFLIPGKETIIEVNTFGIRGCCGSALFEWVKDYNQLYGDGSDIEVRLLI